VGFGLRFKSAALSHGLARHEWFHAESGRPITCHGKADSRDSTAGTSNGVHAKADCSLDPSDTVVFSGARTCGIVVPLIKDREIRLESRK
jgi:hypothetical protein